MESTEDFFLFPDKKEESLFLFLFVLFYLIFKPLCAACAILFSQPGIEPTPLALEGGFLTTGPPGESHIHLFGLEFSCFADVYPGVGLLDYRVAVLLLLLLLSRFSRVRLCATPWTAAYQAPPSMGFSRQEYWSGVPSPPPRVALVLVF